MARITYIEEKWHVASMPIVDGLNIIRCICIYKVKYNEDATISSSNLSSYKNHQYVS